MREAARVVVAGTGSGCGKTVVTCALLAAFKRREPAVAAFKCGPDYIDPMFHREAIGVPCYNLDAFFLDEAALRAHFVRHVGALNVIEGVMGYYDGLSLDDSAASAYEVAKQLQAPAVLVVNTRGQGRSLAALINGFLRFEQPSGISGVLLNRVSPARYPQVKAFVERTCGTSVLGYLPDDPAFTWDSRHLGLVPAPEVAGVRERLERMADQAERTIDLDALTALMRSPPALHAAEPPMPAASLRARIAVARDEAFCFYYPENLEALRACGAELRFFSPLRDARLPDCDGLYLGGGYPELHVDALSANEAMRQSVYAFIAANRPVIAECGGMMYLGRTIDGRPMVGAIPVDFGRGTALKRFGYVTLHAEADSLLFRAGETAPAHEFHYWDADAPGSDLLAVKPGGRIWRCAYATPNAYIGFPHLYFPARPALAERFVARCAERRGS